MSRLMIALLGRAGIAYDAASEGAGGAGSTGGAPAGGAGEGGKPAAGEPGAGGTGAGAAGAGGAAPTGGDGDKPGEPDAAKAEADRLAAAAANVGADEFKDDPTKTATENATAKAAWDAAKPEREAKAARVKELVGAPAKYADVTVPDGMALDQEALNQVFGLAKDLNMSQAAVDKLLEVQKGMFLKQANEQKTAFAQVLKEWDTELKADPVLGGKKHEESTAKGKAFVENFGTPEAKAWLEETKLSENPHLWRMFANAGLAMGEAKTFGGGKLGGSTSAADLIYDKK